MDLNKIFGAFGSSSNSGGWDNKSFNYSNPRTIPTIDEDHPKYIVRMFWKLIIDHLSHSKQLINFFSTSDPSIESAEVEYAGEVMLYARAYDYIKKIDLKDQYHQKVLKEENRKKLVKAYNMSIKFYESEEEYEKCALLKKQLDYIKFLP